jgi:hypothetical protein
MSGSSTEEERPAFRPIMPDVSNIDMDRIMKRKKQSAEPDFIPHNSGGRDFGGHTLVFTGAMWVGGFAAGGLYGFQEGWRSAKSEALSVRMNSVLNQVTKRGNKAANVLGTLAFMHTGASWIFHKLEVEQYYDSRWTAPALAGAVTGGIYKCTASPRVAVLAAGIGAAGSCFYNFAAGYVFEAIFGKGKRF